VSPRLRKKGDPIKLEREIDAFEASLIRDALIKSKGNQRDASKLLGIKPTTLNAKMKRLGISANWDKPYLTMNFEAEATIVAVSSPAVD